MMDGYTPIRDPEFGTGPIENRDKEITQPISTDMWLETKDGAVVAVHIHDGSTWNTF